MSDFCRAPESLAHGTDCPFETRFGYHNWTESRQEPWRHRGDETRPDRIRRDGVLRD